MGRPVGLYVAAQGGPGGLVDAEASPEIVGGFASTRLDNYTAVLILKTAAYIGDDPLPRMACD